MPEYTVKPGDTLWGIAKELGVPLQALQEMNPDIQPTKMQIGTTVRLPTPVQGYDNVFSDGSVTPFMHSGVESTSWPAQLPQKGALQPAGPMGMTAPQQPGEAQAAPNWGRAVPIGGEAAALGGVIAKGLGNFVSNIPRAMRGEMSEDELARFGVESALMTMGGGAFGTGAKAAMAKPLPKGTPRHLPTGTKATGTQGLMQRAAALDGGAPLKDPGIDPMWVDTVIGGKPPVGNVRMPTYSEMALGSGPVRDGNVIRPEFGQPRVPKDPKTNLERRMAKRTGTGEVLPQSRWDQAQIDKYAKEIGFTDPNRRYRMKETDAEGNTMTATMEGRRWAERISKKQQGQAERNGTTLSGLEQRHLQKMTGQQKVDAASAAASDAGLQPGTMAHERYVDRWLEMAESFSGKPTDQIMSPTTANKIKGRTLSEAKTGAQLMKRLEELKNHLSDLKNPEFPAVVGGAAVGAGQFSGERRNATPDDRFDGELKETPGNKPARVGNPKRTAKEPPFVGGYRSDGKDPKRKKPNKAHR